MIFICFIISRIIFVSTYAYGCVHVRGERRAEVDLSVYVFFL